MKANGYTGTYISSLYSNILVKAMDGSGANVPVCRSTPPPTMRASSR